MRRNGPLALIFHTIFVIVMVAPILVVCLVAFTPEGFLSLPTNGFSLRWFRAIASYPEFIHAFWVSLGLGALSLPRPRCARGAVPVAADDPTCRARHRLPALLHLGWPRRQLCGADHRACHHRVSVRAAPDAGGRHRHGPLGRDGGGLARCRWLDGVPPRDAAADSARRHQRLGAGLHPVL